MTKEERRDIESYIKEHAVEYFKRDKSGKGYICPICGSGSGVHGTGITENPKDKGHFTCWTGCFSNADIFEIIGKQFNLTDFNEVFKKACEIYGFDRDSEYTWPSSNLNMTDYHRGISLETLKRFNVTFVPEWRASENAPATPRLIIPNDGGGYLARDTRANLTDAEKKYSKIRAKGYPVGLFNSAALKQTSKPVFVVEGEIDALSIIDAGGEAVAICSTSNVKKLIEAIGADFPPLILQLDNDKAGAEAETKLINDLKEIGFFSYRHYALPEAYKDANEFLMTDKASFIEWVKAGMTLDFNTDKAELESESAFNRLDNFFETVKKNREGVAISTGFENLDRVLDGGLYPGLYTIGANSSIGKTTFLIQVADNIAKTGRAVLYCSLEMSANELIAKSLSRLSFINAGGKQGAKTTRGILTGRYNEAEKKNVVRATLQYQEFSKNLYFSEGVGDIHVDDLKRKVETFTKIHGEPPVLMIDYLQILAPYEKGLTDKQSTDKNITELKRMSRDFGLPVFGISSFNRESYKEPVSMASFKESGAIEYSSDVLIGMQYDGWDYKDGERPQERLFNIRYISSKLAIAAEQGESQRIQAKLLKNRNGSRHDVYFDFFPMFNFFRVVNLHE